MVRILAMAAAFLVVLMVLWVAVALVAGGRVMAGIGLYVVVVAVVIVGGLVADHRRGGGPA